MTGADVIRDHSVYAPRQREMVFHCNAAPHWLSPHTECSLYPGDKYRKTYNISRTLVGNINVDNSDVVGASPVGAAPTTSSFST